MGVLIQQLQSRHQRPGGFGNLETSQQLNMAKGYGRDPTNSVNGNTSGKPLLDVADHSVHLGIASRIQALHGQNRYCLRGL
jgi:hypothetical protein